MANLCLYLGPLFIHIMAAICQMGFSGYYHNYGTISCDHMWAFRKLDYAGIVLMIMGSCTPPFYYGNMCSESQYYFKIFLGQVYVCCSFALYVTLRASRETINVKVNAIAYLIAGYSTGPGLIFLRYYSTEEQVHKF